MQNVGRNLHENHKMLKARGSITVTDMPFVFTLTYASFHAPHANNKKKYVKSLEKSPQTGSEAPSLHPFLLSWGCLAPVLD